MKRFAIIAALVAAAALVAWFFPLFHIVRIEQAGANAAQQEFNAAKFAGTFWSERLVPALDKAVDVETLLKALRENPAEARKQHGRSLGVSRQTVYLVQAQGTIVAIDKKAIGVALTQNAAEPDIALQLGPLFGNAIRDVTGLIRPGDFPNSQHFNDLAAELNRIAEARVMTPLAADAKVGRRVQVIGCVELANDEELPKPLPIIPVRIQFD
jgi:predicted lipoprotein